jgi:hypothetical protein
VRFVTHAQLEGAELNAFRARLAALSSLKPGAALAPVAASRGAQSGREIDRLSDTP